ncbi:hypothetical protein [Luoshenia tenuis]|jgi:hypothetical protein|uniref:hypothetical protein n=1 Tax=Luoshenia tenuis TaxID=2763654 RepID=UPI003D905FD6
MAETIKMVIESSSWMSEALKMTEGLDKITTKSSETRLALEKVTISAGEISTALKGMGSEAEKSGGKVKDKLGDIGNAAADLGKIFADGEESFKTASSSIANIGGVATDVIGTISPLGGLVSGIATAALSGGIALVDMFTKAAKAAVDADVASHFGNVKLSMEDVEKTAQRITTTDWTIKLSAYMDAKGKLDQTENELQQTVAQLNQYNWKINVGMKLSPEEQEDYKAALDAYVAGVQSYAEQQHYATTLALGVSFQAGSATGSRLTEFVNSYYLASQAELSALGKELADVISLAMAENDFEKYQPDIEKLQGRIGELMKDLADRSYEANLANLRVVLASDNLKPDKESYDKVLERIKTETQKVEEEANQANVISMRMILDEYDAMIKDGVSQEAAERIKKQAQDEMGLNLSQQKAEVSLGAFDFTTDILKNNFEQEFGQSTTDMRKTVKEGLGRLGTDFSGDFGAMANAFKTAATQGGNILTGSARVATEEYLESMRPEAAKWEQLAQEYQQQGLAIPESISKGLNDYKELEAMTGSADAAYFLLGQQIANSPEYLAALQEAQNNGEKINPAIIEGIEANSNLFYDEEEKQWRELGKASKDASEMIADDLNQQGRKPGEEIADGLASKYGLVYNTALGQWVKVSEAAGEGSENASAVNQYEGQLVTHAQAEGIRSGEGEVVGAVQEVNASGAQAAQEDQQLPEAMQNKGSEATQAQANGMAGNQEVLNQTLTDQQAGAAETVNNDQQVTEAMYGSGANAMMAYLNSLIENGEGPNAQMQAFLMGLGGMLMLSNLPMLAYMLGGNMGTQLGGGLGSQSWFANGQMQAMLDQMNATASSNAYDPRWSGYGANPISMMAGGMYSQMYAINAQTDSVNRAMNPLGSFPGYIWGHDFGFGFYSGLHDTRELIIMEANGIASAIRRIMHFSRPDEGPLRDYETWMPHFVQGLAEGMDENRYRVMQAARRLSQSVSDEMGFSSDFDFSDFATPDWQGSIKVQSDKFFDPEAIMEAVSRAMRENPVVVENRIDNYTTLELDGDVLARKTEPAISRLMQKKSQLAK